MKQIRTTFKGKRLDMDELIQSFEGIEGVESVDLETVKSGSTGLMNRDPQNQLEVVEIIVNFILSIAGAAAYDAIKAAIATRAQEKGFEEEPSGKSEDAGG